MKTREKTLSYRRAEWKGQGQVNDFNLEEALISASETLQSTAARTFGYHEGEIQGQAIERRHGGLCMHLAYYLPQQPTSVVPVPSAVFASETGTNAPPDGHNFLDGDIFVMIRRNDIVLCSSGARESVAAEFIRQLLCGSGIEDVAGNLYIMPVTNADKLKALHVDGVKCIRFNASVYEATEQYAERTTIRRKLLNQVAEQFVACFGEDGGPEVGAAASMENLSVRIEISFDSRRKGGSVARERLQDAADQVLKEAEEGGFSIITGSDKTLTADGLRVHEKVKLPAYGKSVSKFETWQALADYLGRLRDSGILQQ